MCANTRVWFFGLTGGAGRWLWIIASWFCQRRLGLYVPVVLTLALASFGLLWVPGAFAVETAPAMKAGFAERDISPDLGMEQPGGYGKSYHKVFHDPCKVRASVFDDGVKQVAVVGLDVLIIREPSVKRIREDVAQRTGLDPKAILLAASHTHSGGPTGMVLPGEFDHADDWVKHLAYEVASAADARYLEKVEKLTVEAICEAWEKRHPVLCGVGRGIEDQVAFNRRFRMKNGLTYTHPGQLNPEIVEVAGPTDPEVTVLGVWSPDGKLEGCVVNFACHATTSPGGISANWIYYMEKAIRGFFGEHVTVVFLAGCCGDVTQVNNLSPYQNPTGEEWAKLVGGRVGAEAVKVLLSMPRGQLTPIDVRVSELVIPRRKPDPKRVEECLALTKKDPKEADATKWIFAVQTVLLDAKIKVEPEARVELQAIQLGPLVILANPAEYFCQYGLDLKAKSGFPFTMPVELANGCVGYVPTVDAFGPNGGGYETRLTAYSNLEFTAGDQIRDALLSLAQQLSPGPVPERPKVTPVTRPWSYGSVPPNYH
ncbi:MAG TPA: hypothetical protein PLD05_13340 [Thermogutta sp.]|nr:hypothetical protein [Thermogutta sp.]HPU07643.1 hypothetical protein [Thermogutta sp.]